MTDFELVENSADGQYTARADLAACILQQLTDDRFVQKAVGVITTEVKPNVSQLMSQWSEAFRSPRGCSP